MFRTLIRHLRLGGLLLALGAYLGPLNAVASANSLTPQPYSPVSTGTNTQPLNLAYSPNGKFLAVVDVDPGTVAIYTVDQTTGQLTPDGAPLAVPDPQMVAWSPDGSLLAVPDYGNSVIDMFAVSQTGALTQVGSPTSSGDGGGPRWAAFSPDGSTLVVTDNANNKLASFAVGSGGSLTAEQTASGGVAGPFTGPTEVKFSPSDPTQFAVTFAGSKAVQLFSLSAGGTMTAGDYATTGGSPEGLAYRPNGSQLAVADAGDGTVATFSVTPSGANPTVTALGAPQKLAGSASQVSQLPQYLAFSPSGDLLAVADDNGYVFLDAMTNAGVISPVSGSPAQQNDAEGLAFSPEGNWLAVTDQIAGAVDVYGSLEEPPMVTVSAPTSGATYALGQSVTANFSCTAGEYGEVLDNCADSNGTSVSPDFEMSSGGPAWTWSTISGSSPLNTSSLGPHTYTVTAQDFDGQETTDTIGYTVVASLPSATISSPADGATFLQGSAQATSFSCTEAAGGPGLATCADSNGATGGVGALDTTKVGSFGYSVTATSKNGLSGTAHITYHVKAQIPRPARLHLFAGIKGDPAVGHTLTCVAGAWDNYPTAYHYRWELSGHAIPGATGSKFTVTTEQEGVDAKIDCEVTASNSAGTSSAIRSAELRVKLDPKKGCPVGGGELSGSGIWNMKLGLKNSAKLLHLVPGAKYVQSPKSHPPDADSCLTPGSIQAWVGRTKLFTENIAHNYSAYLDKVVFVYTDDAYYSFDGIHPGETVKLAEQSLKLPAPLAQAAVNPIGKNKYYNMDYYPVRDGKYLVVIAASSGRVTSISVTYDALMGTKVGVTYVVLTHFLAWAEIH